MHQDTKSARLIAVYKRTFTVYTRSKNVTYLLKCMCIEKFSCKKTLLFEGTLEIIYTNSLNDPCYDITLHNELLKTLVYL